MRYLLNQRFLTILFFVFLLTLKGVAQHPEFQIETENLKQEVKNLSSRKYMGRYVGDVRHEDLLTHLETKMKTLGLQPIDTSYRQPFVLYETVRGEDQIKLQSNDILSKGQVVFDVFQFIPEFKSCEVVFGGNGSEDFLDQIEVKDRLVIVLRRNLFNSFQVENYLKKRGALGLLVAPENISMTIKTADHIINSKAKMDEILTTPPVVESKFITGFLTQSAVVKIMDSSRKTLFRAMRNEKPLLIKPVTVGLKSNSIVRPIHTANILGKIIGAKYPEELVVVSAHFDHLKQFSDKIYYPGADDNASGVSAMLEVARAIQQSGVKPDRSILFIAFSAEEEGMMGSKHFFNELVVDTSQIVVNINLDMLGRYDTEHANDQNFLYVYGSYLSQPLHRCLVETKNSNRLNLDFSYDQGLDISNPYRYSDHDSFIARRIPALLFISGLHADYHEPTDTFDKIEYSLMTSRVQFISQFVWNCSTSTYHFSRIMSSKIDQK